MPKYYAVYRATFPCQTEGLEQYFDPYHCHWRDTNRYVSLAYDLGDLTDSQLQSLLSLVGQKYKIHHGYWSADQKKHGVIFLVKYHDAQNLGVVARIEQQRVRLTLEQMQDRYERAIEDSRFDAKRLAPLAYCIAVAEDIRDSQSAASQPVTTPTPAEKKERTTKKLTINDRLKLFIMENLSEAVKPTTSEQLAKKLCEYDGGTCSAASIRRSKIWTKGLKKDANARVIFTNDPEKLRAVIQNQKNRRKQGKPPADDE